MKNLTPAQQAARRACERAIGIMKKGGDKETKLDVAKQLGISRQGLNKWEVVPPGRVHQVSQLTGIDPHNLRPDLPAQFPKRKETAA